MCGWGEGGVCACICSYLLLVLYIKLTCIYIYTHTHSEFCSVSDPSKELWFCGQQFTAADINLCILLGRLDLLGLSERYHNAETRPRLHAYWAQAKKRPTVRRVTVNMGLEMAKMKLKKSVKTVLPVVGGLVTLGLAAGLAYAFAQKR